MFIRVRACCRRSTIRRWSFGVSTGIERSAMQRHKPVDRVAAGIEPLRSYGREIGGRDPVEHRPTNLQVPMQGERTGV
jgi:hypothetical protein